MVDGASYWQRVRRITLPLTYKTILLVTLVSVIGSLLAFDQFFLMTAGSHSIARPRWCSGSTSIRFPI